MAAVSAKSEMPVFSYAQAAKGLSTTQLSTKTPSAEQAKASSTPDVPEPVSTPETSQEVQTSETETPHEAEKTPVNMDKESESAVAISEPSTAPNAKSTASGTYSPSVGTTSTIKDDDSSSAPNGTSESTWDKQSQTSGTEKPSGGAQSAKEKADSTTATATEKSAPPKELKAAPIPVVNVWQQRKEAQEAKAKAMATLKPAVSVSKTPKTVSSASSVAGDVQQDQSRTATKKKGTDAEGANALAKDRKKTDGGKGREDGFRKPGPRPSRHVQADPESTDLTIPPVADAASWPTPQVAQGEEKRKAQEKTEKSDKSEKSPVIRPHGKEKWMPVPYVPSAVFSTPLPSAARRGGRSARGGRDGGRGGAHGGAAAAGSDKAASGQAGQGAAAKQATSADRGRNEPNGTRANALPAQSRRANSADATSPSESRKAPQAADRNRGEGRTKGNEDANAGAAGRHVNGSETFPRYHKSFTRNHESITQKGGDNSKNNAHFSGDSQTGARAGLGHDRRFDNGPRSADFHREFSQVDRDFHKDKDHPRERGERSERGRGSHRSRGGHSTYNASQNSQFPNAHMSHHPFVPKSFGFNDRQRSHHGLPNGSQQGHRLSLRSPSVPTTPAAVYGVYPYPPDVNAMYGYPLMHTAPMSAVPYQQYMEPFSLMSMISMQLEYYFSIDNLCKDLFLRKHMDSQGFVALGFIAGFKRIKTLTEDFELLRHVCRQLRNVEYHAGGDGVDRLRPREKWEQWVLPLEQRDPSARHEGPPPPTSTGKPDENAASQTTVDGASGAHAATNGSVSNGSHKSLPNGTSGSRTSGSPLSSTAPEFSPSNPITTQNENANVGTPIDDRTFPDDQIEKLVIVVRKLGNPSQHEPHFLNCSPHFYYNRSVDALNTAGGLAASKENPFLHRTGISARSSSLDVHDGQHHNNLTSSKPDGEASEASCHLPIFWVQERDSPREVLSSGFVHESYSVFRKRALEKRDLTSTQDGDRDMDVLYQFWSHFLVQNFNAQMYNEFRSLALDDLSARNAGNGFNRLIEFYGSSLSSNRLIPDEVARDLVDLVRKDSTSECGRAAFEALRSAWRDGSFNSKNRKKIDCVLDAGLRAELEK